MKKEAMELPSFSSILLLLLCAFTLAEVESVYFPGIYQSSLKKNGKTVKPKIPYKSQYFPQVLDHFTFQPKSYKIFYQKYLINSQYWHKGAPIFVYTGNEGDIDWFAANTGFMLDIAPKFHALLVFIEVPNFLPYPLSVEFSLSGNGCNHKQLFKFRPNHSLDFSSQEY